MIETEHLRIRRAEPADVDFLVELLSHDEIEPFLSARGARDAEGIRADVERSQSEPEEFGRFVIEVPEGKGWSRAGAFGFEVANRRSRIANLGSLAVHPDYRGHRLADEAARVFQGYLLDELGYHRLQLEIYGFNERAMAHAERVGFTREGVRRKAYWRHGEWVDSVLFGLVAEDVQDG